VARNTEKKERSKKLKNSVRKEKIIIKKNGKLRENVKTKKSEKSKKLKNEILFINYLKK
jgi:hypothetical protein